MKNIEVAAAIISRDGKYFATQRGYGDFEGYWEFPGGKLEPGETPAEALEREIMEELEIRINVGSLFCVREFDYPEFHLTLHCHLCVIADGEPHLLEHKSARWLAPQELWQVKWLPADEEVIRLLESSSADV